MPDSARVHANGINIHYLRQGNGPPLILLHGWPEFSGVWEPCMSELADRFELFAPDLRGFGDTEKPYSGPTDEMTPDALASDLNAFLDALGINAPVGLVSHDVGAAVAQSFARLHPERLRGLFFFNCPYPGIGHRWIEPDHVPEIWYQTFNTLPWAAEMVGSSREACRLYIGHFLRHWPANPHTFDAELEQYIDNFMSPETSRAGSTIIAGSAPPAVPRSKVKYPTCPQLTCRRARSGVSAI